MNDAGPLPYNVAVVLPLSIGAAFTLGGVIAIAVKAFAIRPSGSNGRPIAMWRIALVTIIEAALFLFLWFEAQGRDWQPFLAADLVMAAIANYVTVGRGSAPGAMRQAGRLLGLTVIFPIVQTGIVFGLFDWLVQSFARLFP